jgi:hypothetical protein
MSSAPTDEHAYLFAHTRLPDFLAFMTGETVDGPTADPARLAADWRPAAARFCDLQKAEAGWADGAAVGPLPKTLEPLVRRVAADPVFRRSFTAVPGEVGLVELDRLVVSQKTVNLSHGARVREQLGPTPSLDDVFRVCLPFDHPTPPARIARVASESFVFASESNDLRFLDTRVLRPDQVTDFPATGPLVGVVGVAVGYGSNFLNALALDGRLVLNNGYHRAYALRVAGVMRVPCVVQRLAGPEDLEHVGRPAIRRDRDILFGLARPPTVKDYFDPTLCRTVVRSRRTRHVRVTVSVEELDVP